MASEDHFGCEDELRRFEALLRLADLMVHHQDLGELFPDLTERLHQIAHFEHARVCLHDPLKNTLCSRVWEGGHRGSAPVELPMADTTAGWVWENQQPLTFADLQTETRFSSYLNEAREMGMRSFCELPLTTKQRRFGTFSLGSSQSNLYGEAQLRLLQGMAQMVALSLENVLNRTALQEEKNRMQALLEINAALVSNLDLKELFPAITRVIRNVVKHDFASIALYDEASLSLCLYALDNSASGETMGPTGVLPLKRERVWPFWSAGPESSAGNNWPIFPPDYRHVIGPRCAAGVLVPLISPKGALGVLSLASRQKDAFPLPDVALLNQLAAQVALALENSRAYSEIAQLKDRLAEEKRYLQGEIHSTLNFEEIIGESPALAGALHKAKTVAPSDATVLVWGKTGTGKELLARAIHRMSPRKDANFIKLTRPVRRDANQIELLARRARVLRAQTPGDHAGTATMPRSGRSTASNPGPRDLKGCAALNRYASPVFSPLPRRLALGRSFYTASCSTREYSTSISTVRSASFFGAILPARVTSSVASFFFSDVQFKGGRAESETPSVCVAVLLSLQQNRARPERHEPCPSRRKPCRHLQ